MSTILNGATCQAIYQSLEKAAGQASPLMKRTKTGMVNALTSPLNKSGQAPVKVDQLDGHRRAVKMQYSQRMVESDVEDSVPADCATSNEWLLQETDYDIALFSLINEKVTEDYVSRICMGQGDAYEDLLNGMFNAIQENINSKLLTVAATKFGVNNSTGNNSQITEDIYDETNGVVKPAIMHDFGSDLVNLNQVKGTPIIVSGATMWKATQSLKLACCNDSGVNLQQLAGVPWYYFNDQQIDAHSSFGAGESIVMEAGAAQLVTYYKYRKLGDIIKNSGAYAAFELSDGTLRGLVTDPADGGLTYNLRIFPSTCDEEFTVELSLAFDLFTLPTDMYKTGDTLEGVNGLFNYKFT